MGISFMFLPDSLKHHTRLTADSPLADCDNNTACLNSIRAGGPSQKVPNTLEYASKY